MEPKHRAEQLSDITWLCVENDPYGQFPFLYVIMGADKCVLIDTGTGISNYREFVTKTINTKNLPYLVINTHVHFDHVGGNFRFCGANAKGCTGICMGGNNRVFSENVSINSLAMAHNGAKVQNYTIDKWFKDGDVVYLDDKNPTKAQSLEILLTPGHTPDSISIYSYTDKRLFVGDNLYPYTAIHLDCLGSNVKDYIASMQKILAFFEKVKKEEKEQDAKKKEDDAKKATEQSQSQSSGGSEQDNKDKDTDKSGTEQPKKDETKKDDKPAEKPRSEDNKATAPVEKPKPEPYADVISNFLSVVGLSRSQADARFSVETLLEFGNFRAEDMTDFYLNNMSDIGQLCPPKKKAPAKTSTSSGSGSDPKPLEVKKMGPPKGIVLSCGHVEGNLQPTAIGEILTMLEIIRAGGLPPQHVDSGYGEYSNGNFTVMMATNTKWTN